jgi:hypothetical protein
MATIVMNSLRDTLDGFPVIIPLSLSSQAIHEPAAEVPRQSLSIDAAVSIDRRSGRRPA